MNKKILIVEDEQSLRRALVEKMSTEGFEIIEAGDGEEGLKAALQNKPDLILLDIVMPKMDGITMLGKLRESEWGKNANVLILTNLSSGAELINAIEKNSYEYLAKTDWKLEEIAEKVKNMLK
jgi:DNA-binding response OmpR family regulator